MTTLAYLLLGCAAASRAAAVRVEPSRRVPLAFYALDSHIDPIPNGLRAAARRTWLQVVREVGDDYRFFGFHLGTEKAALDPEADSDFIVIPENEYSPILYVRQFRVIAFAMRWVLKHTSAPYIIKADHDTFLCAGHLHYELAQRRYPSERFFLGDFWHAKGFGCRADENFLLYTRDVVELALKHYLTDVVTMGVGDERKQLNWALSWGLVMRHLWSKGELTVADEATRFDSQQDWHEAEEDANQSAAHREASPPRAVQLVHPDPERIPKGYCRSMLGMHILNKDTRVFDAIMAEGDRKVAYEATPQLAAPLCMVNCSGRAWTECY